MKTAAIAALVALLVPLGARAAAPPTPSPPQPAPLPPQPSAWDGPLAFVIGEAGFAAGALAGGYLGFLAAPERCDDCGGPGLTVPAIGVALLGPPLAAGGVALVGDGLGHRGSYGSALVGTYLGGLAFAGVAWLAQEALGTEDPAAAITWTALFILPVAGGTLGYYLSRPDDGAPAAASGALIERGVDGVVRIGVPAVGFAGRGEETVLTVVLFGGAL
ncbi:MAG: hypothetical protein KC635_13585 [Myxococcales bacterium]|nr:hypothetical protein [Myxococcales bacterium]